MSEHIKNSHAGGVLTLTISRPEKKNALTAAMYAALADAISDADSNKDVRVILITGSEDSFTAGNDLKDFLDNPPVDPSSPVFQFMHAIAGAKKPVVAAVNGLAIGIGTTMLLHCDLVYAVDTARFQLPFVNLGLVPELGSSLVLPALAGRARAAELLMFGDPFNAATANEIGLINAVCSAADLLSTAQKAAEKLAAKPPAALRKTKALLNMSVEDIRARIDQEAKVFGEQLNSAEVKEAIAAFFEKRAPDFSKFD
ncbi:MAG: enoyl-CoA hydratase [Rhodospirillaceae bacterium]|jgi:enoyl-CoA hydratase/carnithine racemase|nr:enoyl-CoA hydratase [Rhodospirillaceae bacterium]MBT5240514.1 enoyl-CoA hydratase [Rhodospirillaceae bacterium]MBT5564921.1 enoyl-CoA hydratase [Rhodospirillaceae bacterium]MBT6090538.1 enoyl-CoA hydratase [Rhodospirillaceae bacterium]MBT6960830.1 enoyl-CoA hydratase [Rhodospirillaceae bacterium]